VAESLGRHGPENHVEFWEAVVRRHFDVFVKGTMLLCK
jgi:hypothetical protein